MMEDCNELLVDTDGYQARCCQVWGTEHSHHDLTARAAAELDLAVCVPGYHDWDCASPGVYVCDICHIVREDS